jgi:hypothetical protein
VKKVVYVDMDGVLVDFAAYASTPTGPSAAEGSER